MTAGDDTWTVGAEGSQALQVGPNSTMHAYFQQQQHAISWPHRVGVVPSLASCWQARPVDDAVARAAEPGGRTMVLAGPAGAGKTQVAANLAHRLWQDRQVDLQVWVTATAPANIVAAYAQAVAELTGIADPDPERAAAQFLAWLARTDRSWLVVFDDLINPNDLTGLWPPAQRPRGRVVVTSRRRDAALADGRHVIDVDQFTPAQAVAYLNAKLVTAAHLNDDPDGIAHDLGYLPLALAQAIAYMVDWDLSCSAFRRRFTTGLLRDLTPLSLPDQHPAIMAASWQRSVELIDRLSPGGLAGWLVKLAALLNPDGIVPIHLFSSEVVVDFCSARTGTEVTADRIHDALRVLHQTGLATVDGPHDTLRMHALVKRAVLEDTSQDVAEDLVRTAHAALFGSGSQSEQELLLSATPALLRGAIPQQIRRSAAPASSALVERYLRDAHDALSALDQEPATPDATVARLRREARLQADDLLAEAREPIAIAVIGQYGAGKSMLAGTLLGRPDLLPVGAGPTTGNVTALHLSPGPPGERTTVAGPPNIVYFSEIELLRCLDYMVAELVDALRAAGMPGAAEQFAGYDPVTDGWDRFDAWCRRHAWPGDGAGPATVGHVRAITAELLAVRDAHLAGPDLIGAVVSVPLELVEAALRRDDGAVDPGRFPQRQGLPAMTPSGVRRDSAQLRRSFALIRRVEYRVRVDPDHWPMDGLHGDDEIVVLDLPGLGEGRSARRDEFLSRGALLSCHTILAVSRPGQAGQGVPLAFYDMLEQHGRSRAELLDSTIAVGNAFDTVAIPMLPPGGTVTVEMLCERSDQFRELYEAARELTGRRPGRVVLTSSVAAIATLDIATSFAAHEAARVEAARKVIAGPVARWGAIGRRLAATEAGHPWAGLVDGFAADGGFRALRRIIEDHVAEHGRRHKLDDLRRRRDRLVSTLEGLDEAAPDRRPPPPGWAPEQARATLTRLADDLRRLHDSVSRVVNEFQDPFAVHTVDGKLLVESMQQDTAAAVAAWPIWSGMLWRAEGGTRLAVTGQDPLGSIEEQCRFTCNQQVGRGLQAFSASVQVWIARRNADAAELREQLADDSVRGLLRDGLGRLTNEPSEVDDRLRGLDFLLDFTWARQRFDRDAQTRAAEAIENRSFAGLDAAPSEAASWIQVVRLRSTINNMVTRAVTDHLAEEISRYHKEMRRDLMVARNLLPTMAEIERMFPPRGDADAAGDSPLRRLVREWKERDERAVR
ncbi:NB-ARC domain-containing protein [Dactylosporangium sp. NPDC000521]|uniref:NB-ARC domain-containing protein n=1 Tax=Dactylosporangium sp. NPDC000521 TaxID=3363975 RepID=UPI00367DB09E